MYGVFDSFTQRIVVYPAVPLLCVPLTTRMLFESSTQKRKPQSGTFLATFLIATSPLMAIPAIMPDWRVLGDMISAAPSCRGILKPPLPTGLDTEPFSTVLPRSSFRVLNLAALQAGLNLRHFCFTCVRDVCFLQSYHRVVSGHRSSVYADQNTYRFGATFASLHCRSRNRRALNVAHIKMQGEEKSY